MSGAEQLRIVAELRSAPMFGHRVAGTDQRTFPRNAQRPTVDG